MPLDPLVDRIRLEMPVIEPDQEVVEEFVHARVGDDPEIITVVGDAIFFAIVPEGAADAVVGGINTGDNRGCCRWRNGGKNRCAILTEHAAFRQCTETGKLSGVDCRNNDSRRQCVDDNE